jgi:hypothetical protein
VAIGETGIRMVQSEHLYTETNAPAGFKAGDREQSYCIFQIHEPVHKELITRLDAWDYRENVESCMKVARGVYEQAGRSFSPWSVYETLAMR